MEEQTVHDLPHYNMTGDGRYVEGGQVFEAAKAVLEEIKQVFCFLIHFCYEGKISVTFHSLFRHLDETNKKMLFKMGVEFSAPVWVEVLRYIL